VVFEINYDGFPALAYLEDWQVRLASRMKATSTNRFPVFCSALADCLPVRDAVLDGEVVHLDAAGKPQFMPLLRRRSPQHFVVFDVLWLNGKDLARVPLVERRRILRSVVTVAAPVALKS
jgi:bifunctional non-homologous end joining protein LigD